MSKPCTWVLDLSWTCVIAPRLQFTGAIKTLIGLYRVIWSQCCICQSGNFCLFVNELDSDQQEDGPSLSVDRSVTVKRTKLTGSSLSPLFVSVRLMNMIRRVTWSSHSENPTSPLITQSRLNFHIHSCILTHTFLMHYADHVCMQKSHLNSLLVGRSTCAGSVL